MYEYHVKRYLPAHIQLPHNFLKSHMPNMSMPKLKQYYNTKRNHTQPEEEDIIDDTFDLPPYQIHSSHSRHSMTPYIGSIQVRVRYSFQHPSTQDEQEILDDFYSHQNVSSLFKRKNSSIYTGTDDYSSSSAQSDIIENYHDAVEPNLVLVDRPVVEPQNDSTVDLMFQKKLNQTNVDFPKTDSENKRKDDIEISDTASIKSHNFGDKNFAFKWINESFEEVALSHPSLDRMIGLVVSPQTRILLRAVVKMINAFVSRCNIKSKPSKLIVTRDKDSKSLSYSSSHLCLYFKTFMLRFRGKIKTITKKVATHTIFCIREPPAEKITDLKFLDEAYYFLGHAIIAYVNILYCFHSFY